MVIAMLVYKRSRFSTKITDKTSSSRNPNQIIPNSPFKAFSTEKMGKSAVFYMALLIVALGIVLLTEPTVKKLKTKFYIQIYIFI